MSRLDLAKCLGIGKAHLSMLERGERKPGLELGYNLSKVTGIPLEKWLSLDSPPETDEISTPASDNTRAIASLKNRLDREHRERVKAEERVCELGKQVWNLEQANERLAAEIRLRIRYGDIICATSFSRDVRSKKLKQLAVRAMKTGELSFDDIRRVFKKKRQELRNWLDDKRQTYNCRFVEGGIRASTKREAALCLRCFDCSAFDSGECRGHGNETDPENIIVLLNRLEKYGVYDGTRQSQILKKHYEITLSPQEISKVRYRGRHGLPIRDDLFFLDVRKRK